jgi:hypothetical protein
MVSPALSWAAPISHSAKSQLKSRQGTRVKWEYCYVVASAGFMDGKQGVAAYLPQGKRLFIPSSTDGFRAISRMLNQLGEQGWQVVGYQSENNGTAGQSWTLTRRK